MVDTSLRQLPRGLLRPALLSAIVFMLVTGLAYPLATTGIAQLLFPSQARGSLIERDGHLVGSAVIGQDFRRSAYFQPRPSATTGPDPANPDKSIDQPYNAALSGASNLGPTSRKLLDAVAARAVAYRKENGLTAAIRPGSGYFAGQCTTAGYPGGALARLVRPTSAGVGRP
jgi:K+-transporting ATPase ATPase C chain